MKRLTTTLLITLLFGCSQEVPQNLGIQESHSGIILRKCPAESDCVTSFKENARGDGQYLEPFMGSGSIEHDYQRVLKLLEADKKAKIVKQDQNYIHAQFTSSILGLIDDVEFYFSSDKQVHFRSAARHSYSFFKDNRDRIEKMRFEFQQSF